jgi:hypothetical protein
MYFESEPQGASVTLKVGMNRLKYLKAVRCTTPCDLEFRRTRNPAYVEFELPGHIGRKLWIEPSLSTTQKVIHITSGVIVAGSLGWLSPFAVPGIVASEMMNDTEWPTHILVTLPEQESSFKPEVHCSEPWEFIDEAFIPFDETITVDGRCKRKDPDASSVPLLRGELPWSE